MHPVQMYYLCTSIVYIYINHYYNLFLKVKFLERNQLKWILLIPFHLSYGEWGFHNLFFLSFYNLFFLTFHNLFLSEVLFFSMKEKNRPVMTWMAVEFEFPASEEQEYSPASFWLASWTISLEVVSPDSDWTKLKHKKGTDIWVQYSTLQKYI